MAEKQYVSSRLIPKDGPSLNLLDIRTLPFSRLTINTKISVLRIVIQLSSVRLF